MFGADKLRHYIKEHGIIAEFKQADFINYTVDEAAAALGVSPGDIGKSLVFSAGGEPIVVISAGNDRIDNGKLGAYLGLPKRKVKFMPKDLASTITGFHCGEIPPFGHLQPLRTIIDSSVTKKTVVYCASGDCLSPFGITPAELIRVTSGEVVDITVASNNNSPSILTGERIIAIGDQEIRLVMVEDVNALITDPGDGDKVPCWAEVWPAARGLATYIWENLDLSGQTVLELGSGLGLPGLICGHKGASITFSDFNPNALRLALASARLNNLTGVKAHLGDWRRFDLAEKFDWVIGSDIFYEPGLNNHLLRILPERINSGGHILIAHPARPATFDFIGRLMEDNSFEELTKVIPVIIDDAFFPYYEIHIHHLQAKG